MSLGIAIDAYSGYRANERPRQFQLDEDLLEIEATLTSISAVNFCGT